MSALNKRYNKILHCKSVPYLRERHLERDERRALDPAADRRVPLPPAREQIQTVDGATRIYDGVQTTRNAARHLKTEEDATLESQISFCATFIYLHYELYHASS